MGYKLNVTYIIADKKKAYRKQQFQYPRQTDDKRYNKVIGQAESFN